MDASDNDEWETLQLAASRSSATEEGEVAADGSEANAAIDTTSAIDTTGADADISTALIPVVSNRARARATPPPTDNQSRMLAVVTKLEDRRTVKDKLMNHPLQLLWSRFLGHLLREVWSLDLRVRLALVLILLGFVIKCFLLSTAVLWYPRLFLVPALILGPFFYLNPTYIPVTFERAVHALQTPSRLVESLNDFDPSSLRRLVCASLFVPTLLEVRTIQFLSQIQIDASWGVVYDFVLGSFICAGMA